MSTRKVKISKAQIPQEMCEKAILKVNEALDKFQIEKDIATYIKKKCDEEFTGTWHVVVGRNFGCSITHETKYVLFFQIDLIHCLIFKSLD